METVTLIAVPGTTVELMGLSKAAMNGKQGDVVSADHAQGRLIVEVGGKKLKIKPDNLSFLSAPPFPSQDRRLAGIQKRCQESRLPIARSVAAGAYEVWWRPGQTEGLRTGGGTLTHQVSMTLILCTH